MEKVIFVIILFLFASLVFVSADIVRELRNSIELVMKCQYHDPPKGPVIAVTPSRFIQIVVLLHDSYRTPGCGRSSKLPINVSDDRTWPFCVFGNCIQGQCQCASHFSGTKCSVYTKKCWLMYCYLTSCHPSQQSLHCICDPNLYGTKTASGIYWYDEGKSSKYVPPPSGWKDDLTNVIQWNSGSAIDKEGYEKKQRRPGILPANYGVQDFNAPSSSGGIRKPETLGMKNPKLYGGIRNPELYGGIRNPESDERIRNFESDEEIKNSKVPASQTDKRKNPFYPDEFESARLVTRPPASEAKYRENAGEDATVKDKKPEKTDVEKALEELEYLSSALILNTCNIYILILIFLFISFIS